MNAKCFLAFFLCIAMMVRSEQLIIKRSIRNQSLPMNKSSGCSSPPTNTAYRIGVGNCWSNAYIVSLQLGTPGQELYFQIDTGSSLLWVSTNDSLGRAFDDNSSTYEAGSQTITINYADGSQVSGIYGSDIVSLLDTPINVRNNILFVHDNHPINPLNIQGILGMDSSQSPNFLDKAYEEKQIQSSVFALDINDDNEQSYFYYNVLPQQLVTSTIMMDQAGDLYWELPVIGFFATTTANVSTTTSQQYTRQASSSAVIDSGTSFFYLNQNLYDLIIQAYFSQCQFSQQSHAVCSCSSAETWPSFSIMFPGVQVLIPVESYRAVISAANSECTFLFGSLSTVKNILLGDIFFREYNITFDKIKSQVGISGNNMNPIQVLDQSYFIVSQYLMMAFLLMLLAMGSYLIWHVKVIKKSKIYKTSELSSYFLQL